MSGNLAKIWCKHYNGNNHFFCDHSIFWIKLVSPNFNPFGTGVVSFIWTVQRNFVFYQCLCLKSRDFYWQWNKISADTGNMTSTWVCQSSFQAHCGIRYIALLKSLHLCQQVGLRKLHSSLSGTGEKLFWQNWSSVSYCVLPKIWC